MNINYRMPVRSARRGIAVLGIAIALGMLLAGVVQAQTDVVFMGPCTGPMIQGQCPVYTTSSRSLTLNSTSIFGRIFSEVDTLYFDNPYANASVTVTVNVTSGPNLDIVSLGAPDPAPNTYSLKWTRSQASLGTHQVQTTGPAGRYRIDIGSNYLSGPGITGYTVTVEVTQTLAAPIPLPPRFVANQCQPPTDLGVLMTGGGLANTRLRNGIELRPGDFDCYEFDVQFVGPKFSSAFGMTWMRFVLNNLPNTGTKFLFLFDMTRGRFPYTWNTSGTSMTQYGALAPGRYRVYVIGGLDGFTSSQYNWSMNTY